MLDNLTSIWLACDTVCPTQQACLAADNIETVPKKTPHFTQSLREIHRAIKASEITKEGEETIMGKPLKAHCFRKIVIILRVACRLNCCKSGCMWHSCSLGKQKSAFQLFLLKKATLEPGICFPFPSCS